MCIKHVSSLKCWQRRDPTTQVNPAQKGKLAAVAVAATNSLPIINEQRVYFLQLARTTERRLNDDVRTTQRQLSINNNHGLGRTLRPSKITGK